MGNLKDKVLYVPIQINGSKTAIAPPYKLYERELFVGKDGTLFVGVDDNGDTKNIGVNALTAERSKSASVTQLVGVSSVPGSYSIATTVAGNPTSPGDARITFDFRSIVSDVGSPVKVIGEYSVPTLTSIGDITYFNVINHSDIDDIGEIIYTNKYTAYSASAGYEKFEFVVTVDKPFLTFGLSNAAGEFNIRGVTVLPTSNEGYIWSMDNYMLGKGQAVEYISLSNGLPSTAMSEVMEDPIKGSSVEAHIRMTSCVMVPDVGTIAGRIKCYYTPSIVTTIGSSLWGPELPTNGQEGQLFFLVQQ